MAFEKKDSQQKLTAQTTSENLSTQESVEAAFSNPFITSVGPLKENRHNLTLTQANIISLQRTVGNRAVQRMIARQSGHAAVTTTGSDHAIQRKLISEANRAFTTAEVQNPAYAQARTDTDQHMSEGDQKKVVDIRETFGKTGGSASDLKDFIRAYLLGQYSARLATLAANTVLKEGEKKKKKAVYLSKSLQVRDKYAPLLKMGPAASETQAFLEEEGFQGGVAVTDKEQQKVLAKGPRIDVRSTFIGGPILGINLRAHLFIVYTSSTGKQMYFRGGPDENDFTVADMGDYTPGTVDWDPSAPSVTVMKGSAAASKLAGLIEATSVIDAMQVPYVANTKTLDGENCNATAWTILNRAGVPAKKPTGIHPGWGNQLGSTLKQGNAIEPLADDMAAGESRVLKDGQVQLYKDQMFMEKDQEVPGGITVTRLEKWTQASKIRLADNKTAFVANGDLSKPKVSLPDGRPFKIVGKPNEIHTVRTEGATLEDSYYPLTGDIIQVMDAAFTGDPSSDNKFVKIKYDTGDGTGEKYGYMKGSELRDPNAVVQPVVTTPRLLKLATDGMVLDDTKKKFVRNYSPKKGENVLVDEPGFTPGDRAWNDREIKIKYNAEGIEMTGYLMGYDFAIG